MARGNLASVGMTKLQLALLLGAPLAIGIGYYVYKRSRKTWVNVKDPLVDKSVDGVNGDKRLAEVDDGKRIPLKEAMLNKDQGNVCFRSGKYDEAIAFYDKAIEKCPPECNTDLAIFYQNRAAAYEMLGQWSKVRDDCTKSIEYNTLYTKAYFRRAKAREALKEWYECLNDVTCTCILETFQNYSTVKFADRILKHMGSADAEAAINNRTPFVPSSHYIHTFFSTFIKNPLTLVDVPELENGSGYVKARLAYKNRDYDKIVEYCSEEIEDPWSPYKYPALLMRGTFLLLMCDMARAQVDLEALMDKDKVDLDTRVYALLMRGCLHAHREQFKLSLEIFDEAEALAPNNPDVYLQRGQLHIMTVTLPAALKDFNTTVTLAPDHPIGWLQKCFVEYRQCVENDDLTHLGVVLAKIKKYLPRFPECAEFFSLMGQVLAQQGSFEQSASYNEQALEIAPDNPTLYVYRAILWLQWKGDLQKANELLYKALEVDSKCELAYETLGTIEVQRANLNKGLEMFDQAIKYSKGKTELTSLYALKNAAIAQLTVTKRLGINLPVVSDYTP